MYNKISKYESEFVRKGEYKSSRVSLIWPVGILFSFLFFYRSILTDSFYMLFPCVAFDLFAIWRIFISMNEYVVVDKDGILIRHRELFSYNKYFVIRKKWNDECNPTFMIECPLDEYKSFWKFFFHYNSDHPGEKGIIMPDVTFSIGDRPHISLSSYARNIKKLAAAINYFSEKELLDDNVLTEKANRCYKYMFYSIAMVVVMFVSFFVTAILLLNRWHA
jgi:hypothetical protein